MCRIPGLQDLAEAISRIQEKKQGPVPGPKPKFKGFSRIPGFPGPLATLCILNRSGMFLIKIGLSNTFFIDPISMVKTLPKTCQKC